MRLKRVISIRMSGDDVTLLQNRRDLAYAVQTQTQEQVFADRARLP
jgi:hypothetical protein